MNTFSRFIFNALIKTSVVFLVIGGMMSPIAAADIYVYPDKPEVEVGEYCAVVVIDGEGDNAFLFASEELNEQGLPHNPRLVSKAVLNGQNTGVYKFRAPAGTEGKTFYFWALGKAANGIWTTNNVASLTIASDRGDGDDEVDYYAPEDGSLNWLFKERAEDGDIIQARGDHPHAKLERHNANYGEPIVIQADPDEGATLHMNDAGGSDTIGFKNPAQAVTLRGLKIQPDDRSAVMFGTQVPYADIKFESCKIGQATGVFWDPRTNTGFRGKWGVLANNTGYFEWSGTEEDPGVICGIGKEHAFYFHSPKAPSPEHDAIVIKNSIFKWLGRTAVQIACRVDEVIEGGEGQGKVLIKDVYIEDVCLGEDGGGSALSFHGNAKKMSIKVENVTVKLGCTPGLHPDVQDNITGALVIYAGEYTNDIGTGELIVKDCHFEVGSVYPGRRPAVRPNVSIRKVDHFKLVRTTIKNHNSAQALVLDPSTVGHFTLGAADGPFRNVVMGDCVFGDQKFKGPNSYADMIAAIEHRNDVTILR